MWTDVKPVYIPDFWSAYHGPFYALERWISPSRNSAQVQVDITYCNTRFTMEVLWEKDKCNILGTRMMNYPGGIGEGRKCELGSVKE